MARHNCRGKLDGRQSAQVSSRQGQVFQASKQQGGLEQEEGEDPKGLPPPFSLKENVDRIRCKNRFISPQNTKEIERQNYILLEQPVDILIKKLMKISIIDITIKC